MLKALFSPQISILEQGINGSSLRHKVISNNIANVNTPGFKKSEVSFEEFLQTEINDSTLPLARTNAGHLSGNGALGGVRAPQINTINSTSFRTDGNNVDVDIEMANLAKNNIYYNAMVNQLSKHFTMLKSAIKEGKG